MKSILAIGGSTSRKSINKQFASWAASQVEGVTATTLDLNDFPVPLYSVDVEEAEGIPDQAQRFLNTLQATDGIVLSLAEHNGSYAAAFKSLLDWTTRIEMKLWSAKPMLLLSTSPGKRGGASVRAAAEATFPHLGAEIVASFGLPSFHDHFDSATGITNPELKEEFDKARRSFQAGFWTAVAEP